MGPFNKNQTQEPIANATESVDAANKAGVASISVSGEERRARQSKIDEWRDRFAAMPKVRIRLTEDTRVQINGYTFLIKGKEYVDVPSLVADVLEQSGR